MLRLWVLVSASLSAGGWLLSLCGQLNPVGYAVLMTAVGAAVAWRGSTLFGTGFRGPWRGWSGLRRRFRRPLPLAFLILAALCLVGGILHPPNMFDAMTYRVPRLLHWAAQGQWHWIHTANARMNCRACGLEWLAMPLLVLTRSDRAFFLPNLVSFLLLPGLIFAVFRRLGVRARVAWSWMWLLPSGYSFLLQAGGSGNDLFAVPYVLAAIAFALQARRSHQAADVWLSLLAAALATGVKASNLPLLLPCALALAPSWRLALSRPVGLLVVSLWAGLVSFLPNAILNLQHCGDWSGAVLEPVVPKVSPGAGIVGNTLLVLVQNFAPPVFPAAGWWNEHFPLLLPSGLRSLMYRSFQNGWWILPEVPVEDGAAPGFGLAVLTTLAVVWVLAKRLKEGRASLSRDATGAGSMAWCRLVGISAWVALLAYMMRAGLPGPGRILTPYVPLLLISLLGSPRHEQLCRRHWWRRVALATVAVAALVLVVSPSRPLFPAQPIFGWVQQARPANRLLARARQVYAVYAQRHDALAPARHLIPPQVRLLGAVLSGDDPETSLWRPFGSRRIRHVLPTDSPDDLERQGIEYVIVSSRLTEVADLTQADWLKKYGADLVGQTNLSVYASQGSAQPWFVARLKPRPGKPPVPSGPPQTP